MNNKYFDSNSCISEFGILPFPNKCEKRLEIIHLFYPNLIEKSQKWEDRYTHKETEKILFSDFENNKVSLLNYIQENYTIDLHDIFDKMNNIETTKDKKFIKKLVLEWYKEIKIDLISIYNIMYNKNLKSPLKKNTEFDNIITPMYERMLESKNLLESEGKIIREELRIVAKNNKMERFPRNISVPWTKLSDDVKLERITEFVIYLHCFDADDFNHELIESHIQSLFEHRNHKGFKKIWNNGIIESEGNDININNFSEKISVLFSNKTKVKKIQNKKKKDDIIPHEAVVIKEDKTETLEQSSSELFVEIKDNQKIQIINTLIIIYCSMCMEKISIDSLINYVHKNVPFILTRSKENTKLISTQLNSILRAHRSYKL